MKKKFIYLLLILLVIIAWEYFGSTNNTVRLYISSPSLVIEYFSINWAELLNATLVTLYEAFSGLILAVLISFGIMFICFYIPKFFSFILPITIGFQVVPIIVLAPFFVLLFGFGYTSKIAMAALISFFPIFVNFARGVESIPQEIKNLGILNNASTWKKIVHIFIPLSLPNIFTGLKISSTLAVIGAIVSEFSGAKTGIGKNLFISSIRLEPDMMVCSLFLSSFIGFILFGLVLILEKKFVKWE